MPTTFLHTMRYLKKSTNSQIISRGLSYSKQSQRTEIRNLLKEEQQGYCAYTEKYIGEPDDMSHIEHFDNRKKGTEDDDYWNWYAVTPRSNQTKPRRFEDFEPIVEPFSESLSSRIHYSSGAFWATNPNDTEAQNLIDLLGWNDAGLAEARMQHIERIKTYRQLFPNDDAAFVSFLHQDPKSLNYITSLEIELSLTLR